jgi:DNA-binding ferritin-like protein
MNEIAVNLKLLNLYAHIAHNLCAHATFFQDHEFFGDLYDKADGYYDSVIERMIGLDKNPNLVQIHIDAVIKLKSMTVDVKENKEYYKISLELLSKLCYSLDEACKQPDITEGTKQLLGGIADEIEALKYKVKQRIK